MLLNVRRQRTVLWLRAGAASASSGAAVVQRRRCSSCWCRDDAGWLLVGQLLAAIGGSAAGRLLVAALQISAVIWLLVAGRDCWSLVRAAAQLRLAVEQCCWLLSCLVAAAN